MINYQLHNTLIEAEQFFRIQFFCYCASNAGEGS